MPTVMTAVQAATTPVFQIDLNNTFGPIVIGVLFACGLFGASCVQALVYFIANPEDAIWLKLWVTLNILLGGADVVALVSVVYTDLVLHFGNAKIFATLGWGARAESLLTTLLVFQVQSFFLFRLFRFTRSWILVLVTAPFVLTTLALGLKTAVTVLINPSATATATEKTVLHVTDFFLAGTDLVLAALMAYFLYKSKAETQGKSKSTEKVITTLIAYSIATGAVTGAIALIGFILAVADPTSTSNQAMYAIIPHTYSNAMLASLNLRQIATRPWRKGDAVELSGFRAQSGFTDSTQVASSSRNGSKFHQVALDESETRSWGGRTMKAESEA